MDKQHSALLKKTVLFTDIGRQEYTALIECLSPQVKHFSKGEIILLTGDRTQYLGVILSGSANAYLEHADSSRTLMASLTPGRMFGEILLSTRTHQSPVTVYADTDVSAAFLEYQRVFSVCASACIAHSVFLQNLLKVIADKYFLLFDRINILRRKTIRSRILAYLYTLSSNGKQPVVTLPFSKTMLSEYLLVNRSALSKELRKMQEDRLLEISGRRVKLIFLQSTISP